MQRTQNYNLCQWAAEDRIMRSDFNADNQKIDAALANGCHIATGTYIGAGEYGEDHPNTLTFDFVPQIVFILGTAPAGSNGLVSVSGDLVLLRPWTKTFGRSTNSSYYQVIIWGERSVSWHCSTSGSNGSASQQANSSGATYYYIAIG